MENLKDRTESGIKWSVIDQVFKTVLSLAISVFLARLIAPKEFGLFAMVAVATGFLNIFRDFGLGAGLIQKRNLENQEIDSIFWVNNVIGLVIGILIYVGASFIVDFYSEPKLLHITQAMAIVFIVGAVGLVPDALIRKNLDFKQFFLRNILNDLISGGIAIGLAYNNYGVWALITQAFLSKFIGTIIAFRMIVWKPSFFLSWKKITPFMRFSLPLLGAKSINYWVRNVDNLTIGKFLGQESLGYYSKAYNLMLLPVRQISGSITRVVFPSFSIIQKNKAAVWKNYIKLLNITSFITIPLMAGMFLLSKEVILILYGEKWLPAAEMLRGLCYLGAIQSIGVYSGSIFSSQNRTFLQFKIGLFLKPLMIIGILGGLYLNGIKGLILGYSLTSTIAFLVESFYVSKILEKSILGMFKGFYKELIGALMAYFLTFVLNKIWDYNSIYIKVIITVLIFSSTYFVIGYFLKLDGLKYLKEKINEIRSNS